MPVKSGLMQRYDTFVFDWDGTLNRMDTILKLKNIGKKVLGIYGRTSKSDVKAVGAAGANIKGRLREEEIGDRLFSRLVDLKMLVSRVKLQEGTVDLLKQLKKGKKAVAMLTDADSYIVLKGVSYHNIEDYFDIIVSTRMFKAVKPSPLGLVEVLRLLKAKKSRTVYIGDTLLDYEVAKKVGVDFCAVASGVDSYETFRKAGVMKVFRTVEEIRRTL
jgi:phosphoglycolate phosphatase-like HAD superfamily hydrolase